jgi:hypothetical protein
MKPAAILLVAAAAAVLGGCAQDDVSATFRGVSVEQVREAYVAALTEEAHPSRVNCACEAGSSARPGPLWSDGVCRTTWSLVNVFAPLGYYYDEQAVVSPQGDGTVKLTIRHLTRHRKLNTLFGGGAFSWLWHRDPATEKERLQTVRKKLHGQAAGGDAPPG